MFWSPMEEKWLEENRHLIEDWENNPQAILGKMSRIINNPFLGKLFFAIIYEAKGPGFLELILDDPKGFSAEADPRASISLVTKKFGNNYQVNLAYIEVSASEIRTYGVDRLLINYLIKTWNLPPGNRIFLEDIILKIGWTK